MKKKVLSFILTIIIILPVVTFCASTETIIEFSGNKEVEETPVITEKPLVTPKNPPVSGGLSTDDVLAVLRYNTGVGSLTSSQLINYDINKDGVIDTEDAVLLLKTLSGTTLSVFDIQGDYSKVYQRIQEKIEEDRRFSINTTAYAAVNKNLSASMVEAHCEEAECVTCAHIEDCETKKCGFEDCPNEFCKEDDPDCEDEECEVHNPKPIIYIITFNPNNGTVSPTSAKTNAEGKLETLPKPTRSNYTFNGWFLTASGGSEIKADYVYTADVTLIARWTYSGGGSSSGGSGGSGGGGASAGDVSTVTSTGGSSSSSNQLTADGIDFSETNNQIPGIQEGDIIKTDGNFIYFASMSTKKVHVIKAMNGKMESYATLSKKGTEPIEMLLYEGKLVIIWDGFRETAVDVYDTGDNFTSTSATYVQDGYYLSSRMINNIIYLITTHTLRGYESFKKTEHRHYIPSYSLNGKQRLVPASCIYLPDKIEDVQYTIVSGLNVNNEDLLVSLQAVLGGSEIVYSSFSSIYITSVYYEGQRRNNRQQYTEISKFSINKGSVSYVATGKVRGEVKNQFYMDEYRDVLRVVTQVWQFGNSGTSEGGSLYTFDKNMRILQTTNRIGINESVRSVRFDNNICYIVTFPVRTVLVETFKDPLYAYDLSDPRKHVRLDELKVPGFSRYLHKWSGTRLLGIGFDANENTGMATGLKLSMFNVSNKKNLSEQHTFIIKGNVGYSSLAANDHRAIVISVERNIIAFPYRYSGAVCYAVFSYDDKTGFKFIGEIKDVYKSGNALNEFVRGVFIGDYIYAATNKSITSMNINNGRIGDTLILGNN